MESTLQRILEVFRLTPSKDKSFERDADCSLFAEKKDFKADRSRKLKDKSIMAQDFSTGGNWEGTNFRKNGVPSKFYPRSQSLETRPIERSYKDESTDRLAVRRNSSLDSETERFCMRYDGEEKYYREHSNAWKLPGKETLITNSKEKCCEESLSEDEGMVGVVSYSVNQETIDAKPWFEGNILDSYKDEDALQLEESICRSYVTPEMSSDRVLHDFYGHTNHLRNADIDQRRAQHLEDITEGRIQADISSYEQWMKKCIGRSSCEHSEPEPSQLRRHEASGYDQENHTKKVTREIDKCRDAARHLSTDQRTTATEEMHDSLNTRTGSVRRTSHRLRRQERIDKTYETDMLFLGAYDTPVGDLCKIKAENLPAAPEDRERPPEIWQDWGGRCQIRICKAFVEPDKSTEEFAYSQHSKGNPEVFAGNVKPADSQEDKFIVDSCSHYSMGKDLRVLHDNASRRPMKLRRDSPFAFPLIEEFARKANATPGSCNKKPGKNHLHANQFSGNVSCFLESQQIGDGASSRHNAMQINK